MHGISDVTGTWHVQLAFEMPCQTESDVICFGFRWRNPSSKTISCYILHRSNRHSNRRVCQPTVPNPSSTYFEIHFICLWLMFWIIVFVTMIYGSSSLWRDFIKSSWSLSLTHSQSIAIATSSLGLRTHSTIWRGRPMQTGVHNRLRPPNPRDKDIRWRNIYCVYITWYRLISGQNKWLANETVFLKKITRNSCTDNGCEITNSTASEPCLISLITRTLETWKVNKQYLQHCFRGVHARVQRPLVG